MQGFEPESYLPNLQAWIGVPNGIRMRDLMWVRSNAVDEGEREKTKKRKVRNN